MKPRGPAPGRTEEVRVHGMSSAGSGVGRLADGRVVFVAGAAPGERTRVRLERERPRWVVGSLVEVLEPAPARRTPPCALYGTCGGCRLQHVPEEVQRALKAELVAQTLARIGGLDNVPRPEVVPSPASLGYRSRMSFTLRRLGRGRVVAGLHGLERPAHVIDVHDECVLPEPDLREAWTALRRGWGEGASRLPAGRQLRLTLRGEAEGVTLLVEGGAGGWEAGPLRLAVPVLVGVAHRPGPRNRRTGPGGEPVRPEDPDPESSSSFEQVNRGAATLLGEHVARSAGGGPGRAVDAYCGSGPYGRALARRGWSVVGIERDPEGVARAREGAPDGFRVREGDVARLLPEALPAELLIVNPPRSGLAPGVVETLRSSPPARAIYVSCDPATLARDLGRMADLYAVDGVRCFDLFPQTAHVETVVVLSRRGEATAPAPAPLDTAVPRIA